MSIRARIALCVLGSVLIPHLTVAQPLGAFRWQQQPYCNVLVVNVVQNGAVYNLDGFDDQCGAGTAAAVVGMAFLNPDGSIGLGFTVVTTPGGTALHIDAIISLPSASGTWRDSNGGTGAFVLTPGAPMPGSARPVPASLAAVRAAMIGEKVWKARLSSTGLKRTTGPYTSSRVSLGRYSIQFDVTGLGLVHVPGQVPVVTVSPFAVGATQAVVGGLGTVDSGGFLTQIATEVRAFTTAGAAVDAEVIVMLAMPDADSGSPVPPLDPGASGSDGTCTTVGDTTTCTYTPPRP